MVKKKNLVYVIGDGTAVSFWSCSMINLIMLEEFWREEEDLERHLRSED